MSTNWYKWSWKLFYIIITWFPVWAEGYSRNKKVLDKESEQQGILTVCREVGVYWRLTGAFCSLLEGNSWKRNVCQRTNYLCRYFEHAVVRKSMNILKFHFFFLIFRPLLTKKRAYTTFLCNLKKSITQNDPKCSSTIAKASHSEYNLLLQRPKREGNKRKEK